MTKNKILRILIWLSVAVTMENNAQPKNNSLWCIDNLKEIGGYPVSLFGNPVVKNFSFGKAIEFDGIDDGIIVQGFQLNKESTFTAEIIFNPYASFPNNVEQRFLHVQSLKRGNRRFLIELRLNDKNQWFVDTHIRTDSTSLTCLAKDFPHPINKWYHVVFTYNNGIARHYVNGIEEMSGKVNYIPVDSASVSIGMRMNQVSFFKGAIYCIAFSKIELNPSEFMLNSKFAELQKKNSSELLFKDEFKIDEGNWISEFEKPSTSFYKIKDKILDINTSAGATLWYKNKLKGNIEISYDAIVVDSSGINDRVSDLNAFWMATDPLNQNIFTRDGKFSSYDNLNLYYVGFGGNENTTTRFRKYSKGNKPVIKEYLDSNYLLKGNKEYQIKIICNNGNTSFYVNDELYFNYHDKVPLKEGYFAFRTTRSHLQIKNFKVLSLTERK